MSVFSLAWGQSRQDWGCHCCARVRKNNKHTCVTVGPVFHFNHYWPLSLHMLNQTTKAIKQHCWGICWGWTSRVISYVCVKPRKKYLDISGVSQSQQLARKQANTRITCQRKKRIGLHFHHHIHAHTFLVIFSANWVHVASKMWTE